MSKPDKSDCGPHGVISMCHKCGKKGNLRPCDTCNVTEYCSEECRVTHLDEHAAHCVTSDKQLMITMQQDIQQLLASEAFGVFMHALAWHWRIFTEHPQCHMQCDVIALGDGCMYMCVTLMNGVAPNGVGHQHLSILYNASKLPKTGQQPYLRYTLTMKKNDCELMHNGRNIQLFDLIDASTIVEIMHHLPSSTSQVTIGALKFIL